jgi:hypothetical protein
MPANLVIPLFAVGGSFLLVVVLILWTVRARKEEMGEVLPPPPAQTFPTSPEQISLSVRQPMVTIRPTEAAGSATLLGKILGNLMPNMAELQEFSEFVRRKEEEAGRPLTKEEKTQVAREALEMLIQKYPDNPLFRQMYVSIGQLSGGSPTTEDGAQFQVTKVDGKVILRVNGREYSSPEEIPDPVAREQVRKLLDSMGGG